MDLIDFCKHPPKKITRDNIFDYTNLDFSSKLWPFANTPNCIYRDTQIVNHICDNIIDINVIPTDSQYCLLSKVGEMSHIEYLEMIDSYILENIKINIKCVINSGYCLYNYKQPDFCAIYLIKKKQTKYANKQQHIKNLVIDNPNYFPKNIIKYNHLLVPLLWALKYQKIFPKVLIQHKIIPFVYT